MSRPEPLSEFAEVALHVRGMDVRVFQSEGAVADGRSAFVLIHGFGVSSRYFGPLAAELSRHGRVLVLDLPGFGRTSDPDHAPRITGFAHVVNAAMRQLDARDPVLVGHSMGTQVAVESLLRAPGLAVGAVLAAPVVNDRERTMLQVLWRFIQSAIKEPPDAAWDSIRGYLHSGPRWLLRNFTPMLRYRLEVQLRAVKAPVEVVGGSEDRIAPPAWCRRLATARSGVGVSIVDGAAHQMIHTNAPEVARIAVDIARFHPTPGLPSCGA